MSFSSSDPSNRPIVDEIFQEIARCLWPIVNKKMTDHGGAHWADSKNRNIEGDLSAIVGVILGNWESCFTICRQFAGETPGLPPSLLKAL